VISKLAKDIERDLTLVVSIYEVTLLILSKIWWT